MSLHHEPGPLCPSCEEKVLGGHTIIQSSWREIKHEFPDAHIAWCFRNAEEQDQCFNEGKSDKIWPHSRHNKMEKGKPCSWAIDLFKLSQEGVALFPPRFYYDISKFIDTSNLPLEWSGKWKGFKELDHFQLMEGMII